MLEIKCDEEDSSMNLDLAKFFDFCCKHELVLEFGKDIKVFDNSKLENHILRFSLSDFHFPKNLLRELKEKMERIEAQRNPYEVDG